MAEQNKLPTFSFGNFGTAPASSAGSDASKAPQSPFGNTSSSNLFGNSPASSAAQSNPAATANASLFGGFGATSGSKPTTTASASPFSGFGATSGLNTTTASPFGDGLGATSGAQSGPLFGSSAGQPGGLFGGASGNAQGASQGVSLFGSGNKPPASTGFSFGKKPEQPSNQTSSTPTSLFGEQPDQPSTQTSGTPTSLFGKRPDQPKTSTPATNTTLFGSIATPNKPNATGNMNNLFGQPNNDSNKNQNQGSNNPPPGTPSSNQPATTLGPGMFGSTTPAGPPPQSGTDGASIFNTNPQPRTATGNPFGNPSTGTPAPSGANASRQGNTSNTGSNIFGGIGSQPGNGSFSNLGQGQNADLIPTQNSTQIGGGAATSKPASFNLFTQPTASDSQPASTTPAAPASRPAAFNFPAASQPAAASAPQPPASQPANAPGTSSLFAPLNTTAAAPAPSGGAPISSILGSGTTTTSTAGVGAPPISTSNLFSNLNPPATATGSATTTSATAHATSTMTTTDRTGATTGGLGASRGGLGASTTGPAPSAQSRLRNKTMDEILTRWASDLTKYQKEFQNQAERVAGWDRMVVDNSEKIQKLYGRALEAERATAEVEKQLTVVESQQDELRNWLDSYESKVDEMMSRQMGGDGLQGPDQERERTYKVAEKLSERLDDMGRDLTTMIGEINGASAALSKNNKEDEPITQIVRILNSHLSQLQQIDQGAKRLQDKVTAAQQSSQTLTLSDGQNRLGRSAADDFYSSYMGRR